MGSVGGSLIGREIRWEFFQKSADIIKTRFGDNKILKKIVEVC